MSEPLPKALSSTANAYAQQPYVDWHLHSLLVDLNTPLVIDYLSHHIVCDYRIECLLTGLRKQLLTAVAVNNTTLDVSKHIKLISALAQQCFHNQYIYFVTQDEQAIIDGLIDNILDIPQSTLLNRVLIIACYQGLSELADIHQLIKQSKDQLHAIRPVLKQQVEDLQQEQRLQTQITTIDSQLTDVSARVECHYKNNPYPRWVTLEKPEACTLEVYHRQRLLPLKRTQVASKKTESILVVGCGTGLLAVEHAYRFPDSQIVGIDLSLTSLGYAQRRIDELSLGNIELFKADVHAIAALRNRFDLIECIGVLSHTEDPKTICSILADQLSDNGLIRASLYSQTAMSGVQACRRQLISQEIKSSDDGIRALRRDIDRDPKWAKYQFLLNVEDFYSMSSIRDMLCHEYVRYFQIKDTDLLTKSAGLDMVGLEIAEYSLDDSLNPETVTLASLQQFENAHPYVFFPDYVFWLAKSAETIRNIANSV